MHQTVHEDGLITLFHSSQIYIVLLLIKSVNQKLMCSNQL
jgi:hypothetical protein